MVKKQFEVCVRRANIFYHEGMKPASAGTLKFWWRLGR